MMLHPEPSPKPFQPGKDKPVPMPESPERMAAEIGRYPTPPDDDSMEQLKRYPTPPDDDSMDPLERYPTPPDDDAVESPEDVEPRKPKGGCGSGGCTKPKPDPKELNNEDGPKPKPWPGTPGFPPPNAVALDGTDGRPSPRPTKPKGGGSTRRSDNEAEPLLAAAAQQVAGPKKPQPYPITPPYPPNVLQMDSSLTSAKVGELNLDDDPEKPVKPKPVRPPGAPGRYQLDLDDGPDKPVRPKPTFPDGAPGRDAVQLGPDKPVRPKPTFPDGAPARDVVQLGPEKPVRPKPTFPDGAPGRDAAAVMLEESGDPIRDPFPRGPHGPQPDGPKMVEVDA
ncbi:uncharacterized protein AB675_1643 [Cyphellophora attinorum]|uniref:Uncharacterized protein n=1 Tax=Cyphellophora attinorum TaxID=1664694 RepID=A0A0N1H4B1_9EURO|nr:uncharacterized protein AB675_1643 [Phialophora attinorum]KPI36005.1 hypothetical protein AB675_1643 [Phialophora attinorum]